MTRRAESAGAPLTARWRAQAAAVGWTAAELSAALHRGAAAPGRLDEHRFAAGLGDPVHGAVTRRQALTAWAGALRGGTPAVDAERCADRLATWGDGVGVAEERRPPSDVVPAAHLLAALGPRPGSPRLLETWQDGADAVARYRARWGVTDRSRPLGTEGSGAVLAAMGAQRLADHLATTRRLERGPARARTRGRPLGGAARSRPRPRLNRSLIARGRARRARPGRCARPALPAPRPAGGRRAPARARWHAPG